MQPPRVSWGATATVRDMAERTKLTYGGDASFITSEAIPSLMEGAGRLGFDVESGHFPGDPGVPHVQFDHVPEPQTAPDGSAPFLAFAFWSRSGSQSTYPYTFSSNPELPYRRRGGRIEAMAHDDPVGPHVWKVVEEFLRVVEAHRQAVEQQLSTDVECLLGLLDKAVGALEERRVQDGDQDGSIAWVVDLLRGQLASLWSLLPRLSKPVVAVAVTALGIVLGNVLTDSILGSGSSPEIRELVETVELLVDTYNDEP